MRSSRFIVFLALIALLLAVVPATLAQDFGISGEDLAALGEANENSAAADSFAYGFDFTISISGTGEADGTISFVGDGTVDAMSGTASLNMDGTADIGGMAAPITVETIISGDELYITAVDPETGEQSPWFVISLTETFEEGMTQAEALDLPVDPMALASGDMSAMGDLSGVMTALAELDPTELIFITLAEGEIDGIPASIYEIDVDLMALATSEAVAQIATAGMMMQDSSMDAESAEMMSGMVMGMIGNAISVLDLSVEQWVGDDGFVYAAGLDFALEVNPAALGAEGDPLVISFVFDIDLFDYNADNSVVPPADATPVSIADIMGGGF